MTLPTFETEHGIVEVDNNGDFKVYVDGELIVGFTTQGEVLVYPPDDDEPAGVHDVLD